MVFYKIMAIFLISSPITILTPTLFFPYSYLGLVLFFLADWFTFKPYFSIINMFFLCFCSLAIIMSKPISYQLMIQIFTILQYINFSLMLPKLGMYFFVGIILAIISFFTPIALVISNCLLGIVLLIYYVIYKRQLNQLKSSTLLLEEEDIDNLQIQERIIPITEVEEPPEQIIIPVETGETQELEYVIPHKPDDSSL